MKRHYRKFDYIFFEYIVVRSFTCLRLCLFSFVLLFAFPALSQPGKDSLPTKYIDGRKFYIHKVSKGETLYGISKKYDVEIKDIVLENPLTINGLSLGLTIRIPATVKTFAPKALDRRVYVHTIKKGDTFYSLSKQYSVSIDDIKSANPGIENGLKTGLTVNIPLNPVVISHDDVRSKPGKPDSLQFSLDTLYTDTVAIDTLSIDTPVFKDSYNISLMLPFYLNLNDSLEANKKMDEEEKIYLKSKIALDFYAGAFIAIDSMKKQGISFKLFVYDTKNDTGEIMKIIRRKELVQMDLIIGPLYRSNFSIVTDFAGENGIPVVSPLISTNRILKENPHVIKAKPCVQTNMEKISLFVAKRYVDKKIIVIHNEDQGEKLLSKIFVNGISRLLSANMDSALVVLPLLRTISYQEREMEAVEEALSVEDTNIIIIPSRDQVFVSMLISELADVKENYNMVVFGLPVWEEYKNLEIEDLHDLNVHIASSYYIDYCDSAVISFIKEYYYLYNAFPGNYAFLGFDIMYYYLNVLKTYGYKFLPFLQTSESSDSANNPYIKGLQASFIYKRNGIRNGLENKNVFILKYEDYELVPQFLTPLKLK